MTSWLSETWQVKHGKIFLPFQYIRNRTHEKIYDSFALRCPVEPELSSGTKGPKSHKPINPHRATEFKWII
jgi:hypothetical protein